jgi:hypothetical protein
VRFTSGYTRGPQTITNLKTIKHLLVYGCPNPLGELIDPVTAAALNNKRKFQKMMAKQKALAFYHSCIFFAAQRVF